MTPKRDARKRQTQYSDKDRIETAMKHLFAVAQIDDVLLEKRAWEVVYSTVLMGRELHKGRQEQVTVGSPFESRPPGSVPPGYWKLMRRLRAAARVLPRTYLRLIRQGRDELVGRLEDAARVTTPCDVSTGVSAAAPSVAPGGRPSKCAQEHVDAATRAYRESGDREETYRRVRKATGAPVRTQRDWYNRRGTQHERAFADACGWELGE